MKRSRRFVNSLASEKMPLICKLLVQDSSESKNYAVLVFYACNNNLFFNLFFSDDKVYSKCWSAYDVKEFQDDCGSSHDETMSFFGNLIDALECAVVQYKKPIDRSAAYLLLKINHRECKVDLTISEKASMYQILISLCIKSNSPSKHARSGRLAERVYQRNQKLESNRKCVRATSICSQTSSNKKESAASTRSFIPQISLRYKKKRRRK